MIDLQKLQEIILSGLVPDTTLDACVLPEKHRLESLEPLRPHPARLRGAFSTPRVGEFVDYCLQHASPSSRLFIDPDRATATCVLNHGTQAAPEWGDFTAILTLKETPEYTALKALLGTHKQEQMIDYTLDWAPILEFHREIPQGLVTADNALALSTALQRLRKLETKVGATASYEENDLKRERSLLETAAITNDPPAAMTVRFKPYEDLQERSIWVRLAYKPQDPPLILLRLIGAETLARDLADEFRDTLIARLKTVDSVASRELSERTHVGTFK